MSILKHFDSPVGTQEIRVNFHLKVFLLECSSLDSKLKRADPKESN